MKLRRTVAFVVGATIVALLAFASGQEAVAAEGAQEVQDLIRSEDAAQEQVQPEPELKPVSEAPIKRVHNLNPGEREYLSPNLIGVQNIAITFLPLSMNFINIIDAFREIVDGVRYEIIANAVDTREQDAEIICRLVVLEKPWLRTQWGDKVRELRYSNCTSDADNLTDPEARSNTLNEKYVSNALFNGGSRNELSNDEQAELEAQILSGGTFKRRASATTSTTSTTTTTTTTEAPLETATESSSAPPQNQVAEYEAAATAAPTSDDASGDAAANTEPPVLNANEMKWLDDFLSVGALNFEATRQDSKLQNEAKPPPTSSQEAASEVINNESHSNYVQQASALPEHYEESVQQEAAPVQQQQQEDLQRQQQQEDVQQLQQEDVQQLQQEDVQRQQQEEDIPQQQQSEPEQFEDVHVRAKRSQNTLTGGVSQLSDKEAEETLQESLDKLAAGDGPNYKIHKIHSASTQVVSGTLTKIDASLIDGNGVTERCSVEIWSRRWLANGNEVTIDCPNKEQVKRRHSRSVEYAEKKTHKKHNHHNLEKTEHLFNKFQVKFSRNYANSLERQMRLRIFKQNLRTIEELNQNEMGSAKYGVTEFADMTSTEYKERTGLWQRTPGKPTKNAPAAIPDVELPKEFDWREKGVISEVKNQGSCGSCWAFSVTGNIEGLHAVKTGKLEEYSEQELLDCDTTDSACNGGLPDNAYEAILKIGGLELESDYPYTAHKDQCRFNKNKVHVKVSGAIDLPKNETAMQQWLLANGPISIGINANAMQFYRGGVSHPWKPLCSHSNLDHGVLIVGYGVSDYPNFKKTLPYWIVKNSWGPKWGEQGYYRVYRGDNTCGVSEMASSAVLADD